MVFAPHAGHREWPLIGRSAERSFALDLEVSVMIVDHGFRERMERIVEQFTAHSTRLDLGVWEKRPLGRKFVENVCRLTSGLL